MKAAALPNRLPIGISSLNSKGAKTTAAVVTGGRAEVGRARAAAPFVPLGDPQCSPAASQCRVLGVDRPGKGKRWVAPTAVQSPGPASTVWTPCGKKPPASATNCSAAGPPCPPGSPNIGGAIWVGGSLLRGTMAATPLSGHRRWNHGSAPLPSSSARAAATGGVVCLANCVNSTPHPL